jgi:hypothetical protein
VLASTAAIDSSASPSNAAKSSCASGRRQYTSLWLMDHWVRIVKETVA